MRWSERAPAARPRSLSLPPFPCGRCAPSVPVAHLVLVRRMRHPLLLVMLLLAANASASEEGALAFRTFRFESRDASGPIVVTGAQGDQGITSLHVSAFRKSFTLSPAQLKQLRGLIVNAVQLSGEGGYKELGGRTLYLVLSMGFTDGTPHAKLITLDERGDIKVEDVQRP